jgi:hypothetical protein
MTYSYQIPLNPPLEKGDFGLPTIEPPFFKGEQGHCCPARNLPVNHVLRGFFARSRLHGPPNPKSPLVACPWTWNRGTPSSPSPLMGEGGGGGGYFSINVNMLLNYTPLPQPPPAEGRGLKTALLQDPYRTAGGQGGFVLIQDWQACSKQGRESEAHPAFRIETAQVRTPVPPASSWF